MTNNLPSGESAVAVVSAAGSGIGQACVLRLADRGHRVIAVDIDGSALDRIAGANSGPGSVRAAQVDVTSEEQVNALVSDVIGHEGAPAILINVVGGAQLMNVADMPPALWEAQVRFNLTSTYLMCHGFLPSMIENGGGAIVNTSSGWGFMPAPGRAAYAASKAGIVAFSRALASEVAKDGVRVNVVAPGPIETERMRALTANDPLAQSKHQQIPVGRLGQPGEVAAVACFLASAEASFVCGQVVHVNGGVYMP
jgi:NAD(P)-dependent dehydrogenase (short-subunit alcohol dehydrogenase family)